MRPVGRAAVICVAAMRQMLLRTANTKTRTGGTPGRRQVTHLIHALALYGRPPTLSLGHQHRCPVGLLTVMAVPDLKKCNGLFP